MKPTLNFVFLLLATLTMLAQHLFGQVGTFSATLTQQETMLISWSMNVGLTCIDLELQHAGEDLNFDQIYLHNGICGSTDKEEYYNYEQEFNIKTTNYYRLKLGFAGFSDTIRIDAPLLGSDGVILFPQPSNGILNFLFNNPKTDNYNLTVFNLNGAVLKTIEQFKGNLLQLSTDDMPSGLYFYKLESYYFSHSGKFVIKH